MFEDYLIDNVINKVRLRACDAGLSGRVTNS